uniref:Uncharacterized protein n=1 Tax=Oryza barthii TaxID=65489 RepID=A0A0D3GLY3_9ORYZ
MRLAPVNPRPSGVTEATPLRVRLAPLKPEYANWSSPVARAERLEMKRKKKNCVMIWEYEWVKNIFRMSIF